MKELSIIIPTYKNTCYLNECFFSIIESIKDRDIEILVGIDACLETISYVKNNIFEDFIKFYVFKKNQGPYIIKNSLLSICESENILCFDSDDIMCENFISEVLNHLKFNDVVKPSYLEFEDNGEIQTKIIRSEGVFAIKKKLLLDYNGFEPWVCAADTDLSLRLIENGIKFKFIDDVLFYRRIHKNGLTSRHDTGSTSEIRSYYNKLIINKKTRGKLDRLHTESFYRISEISENEIQEVNDIFKEKQKKKKIINSILRHVD